MSVRIHNNPPKVHAQSGRNVRSINTSMVAALNDKNKTAELIAEHWRRSNRIKKFQRSAPTHQDVVSYLIASGKQAEKEEGDDFSEEITTYRPFPLALQKREDQAVMLDPKKEKKENSSDASDNRPPPGSVSPASDLPIASQEQPDEPENTQANARRATPKEVAFEILQFLKESIQSENEKRRAREEHAQQITAPPSALVKKIAVSPASTLPAPAQHHDVRPPRAEMFSEKNVHRSQSRAHFGQNIADRSPHLSPYVLDVKRKALPQYAQFVRAKSRGTDMKKVAHKVSSLPRQPSVQKFKAHLTLCTKGVDDVFGDKKIQSGHHYHLEGLSVLENFFIAVGEVLLFPFDLCIMRPYRIAKKGITAFVRLEQSALWAVADLLQNQTVSLLFERKPLHEYLISEGMRAKLAGAAVFTLVGLLLVLPIGAFSFVEGSLHDFKGRVLGATQSAADEAAEGAFAVKEFQFDEAAQNFSSSGNNFRVAQKQVEDLNILIRGLVKSLPQGKAALELLNLGEKLSYVGEILSEGAQTVLKNQRVNENFRLIASLTAVRQSIQKALPIVREVESLAKDIRADHLPQNYQAQVGDILSAVPLLASTLQEADEISGYLLYLLGDQNFRRYLVIGANSLELRPSFGGFMGNVLLLEVSRGAVMSVEVLKGGPYELQGSLLERVLAPKQLWGVNPRWEFQDCNWFADGPASAEKCLWFWEKSGRPSVDGMISVTDAFLRDMLAFVGPIEISVAEFGMSASTLPESFKPILGEDGVLEITSGNVIAVGQSIAESSFAKQSQTPKAFFAALTPKIIQKLEQTPKEKLPDITKILIASLRKKESSLYIREEHVAQWLSKNNFDGHIRLAPKDYLHVNRASIGGGKSDQVIQQKVKHSVRVDEFGGITDEVTIELTHLGADAYNKDSADIISPTMRDELNRRNVAYMQVYVPHGSALVRAEGDFYAGFGSDVEIPEGDLAQDQDIKNNHLTLYFDEKTRTEVASAFGKTVFSNAVLLSPGETKRMTFVYTVPFTIQKKQNLYSLLIQKQAGARIDSFESVFYPPRDLQAVFIEGTRTGTIVHHQDTVTFQDDLSEDSYYVILLK